MKKQVKLGELVAAFSYAFGGVTAIQALKKIPFSSVVCHRVSKLSKTAGLEVDAYWETHKTKEQELHDKTKPINEEYQEKIKAEEDAKKKAEIEKELNEKLAGYDKTFNDEMEACRDTLIDLKVPEVKLSHFAKTNGEINEHTEWHPFRAEFFDLLDWLIIDDVDTDEDDEEIEGLEENIENIET